MIENAILNYTNLEDQAYLAAVFAQSDANDVIDAIVRLLRHCDHEVVGQACLFIRDLLVTTGGCVSQAFRDSFDTSALVPELEHLVLAPNHLIRWHAIYTLGKTGTTRSLPALHHAFSVLLERDQILLPRLVTEIMWLEAHEAEASENWQSINGMVASQQFTTRWAVLGILEPYSVFGDTKRAGLKQQCLAQLCGDNHPLVRAEAEYEYQQLLFERHLESLTKAERRQQQQELDCQQPGIRFSDIEHSYRSHLYKNGIIDYSIADLEQFISDSIRSKANDSPESAG